MTPTTDDFEGGNDYDDGDYDNERIMDNDNEDDE